jgi:hypothetical protein
MSELNIESVYIEPQERDVTTDGGCNLKEVAAIGVGTFTCVRYECGVREERGCAFGKE